MIAAAVALAAAPLTACDAIESKSSSSPTASNPSASTDTSAPSPANASLPDDICALLTKEEASELLATQIKIVKPSKEPENGCDYDTVLNISVSTTTQAEFDNEVKHSQSVAGVGDAAHTAGTALSVRLGTTKLLVHGGGGEEHRTAVARKVVERLDAGNTAPSLGGSPTQ